MNSLNYVGDCGTKLVPALGDQLQRLYTIGDHFRCLESLPGCSEACGHKGRWSHRT